VDCFAEPVIRRRFAPTGWLAMTENMRAACATAQIESIAQNPDVLPLNT
jgi:hypothetical protein